MVFGNGVKNIQAAAYNGARTVVWAEQHAPYTRFLPRPARKESNVSKLTALIYTVVFALPNNQDVFIKILQNFAKLRKLQPHLMERRRMNDVGFCIDHIRTYQ